MIKESKFDSLKGQDILLSSQHPDRLWGLPIPLSMSTGGSFFKEKAKGA
jgi:hypothetical protein